MKDLILHILRGIYALLRIAPTIWHRSAVHSKENEEKQCHHEEDDGKENL